MCHIKSAGLQLCLDCHCIREKQLQINFDSFTVERVYHGLEFGLRTFTLRIRAFGRKITAFTEIPVICLPVQLIVRAFAGNTQGILVIRMKIGRFADNHTQLLGPQFINRKQLHSCNSKFLQIRNLVNDTPKGSLVRYL